MTGYVCTELAPVQSGYVPCKTWVAYDSTTWVDKLAITKQQMVEIGTPIITVLALCLAFTLLAKATKLL
jgi:hypothetical protein